MSVDSIGPRSDVSNYTTVEGGGGSRGGGRRYPLSFRLVLQLVYDSRNFSFEGNRCVLSILLVYELFRCRERERERERERVREGSKVEAMKFTAVNWVKFS